VKALRNQVALVTGAKRGIGLAIARALAAEGCDLVITGRNQTTLNKASRELARRKIRVLPSVCDVRNPHAVKALLATVKTRFYRLDILINNAGVAHPNLKVAKLPFESWQQVTDTNLTGLFVGNASGAPAHEAGRHNRE
jgi:NAD(P)-dependent dehydrogenase (short-subunit alcohol dehydrogenase family)